MGVTTSKAPNPGIADKNDPRYTPLNDFDIMGLKTLVGGQDAILGGINVIGRNELQIKAYLQEGIKAEVGDTILIAGNRKGIISAAVYADDNPDVVLTLTVIEQDIPQRNAASAQDLLDDGFIGQNTREVDYIFGIQTATGTESGKISGATTHTLILGTPTVIKKKTIDPSTWNPIAQAMRKYAGTVPVTVTVDVYIDGGVTKTGAGNVTFTSQGNGDIVVGVAVAGTVDVVLEPGVTYAVTDGDTSVSEVQETGNGFFTPADTADVQICTIWNYVA